VNLIVDSLVVITMFLCFFSLSANMSANLYDQTKEIAVLRSIGLTKSRVKILYFYEAMILVLTSCLLGVFIGIILGQTLSMQITTSFDLNPLPIIFPWEQFAVIFVLSIICAFSSTYGPTSQMLSKQISAIYRSI